MQLDISAVPLNRGARITFTNDEVIHNVHIFGPGDFEKNLGLQKPGVPLSHTLDKSRQARVRCNIRRPR